MQIHIFRYLAIVILFFINSLQAGTGNSCGPGEIVQSEAIQTLNAQIKPIALCEETWSPQIVELQTQIQNEAFRLFLKDLEKINPEWVKDVKLTPLKLIPSLSRNAWISYFIKQIPNPQHRSEISRISDQLFFSYYEDLPFARIPYLKKRSTGALVPRTIQIKKSSTIPLPKQYPTDHTVDLEAYVSERFPKSLRSFLTEARAQLFVHFGTCDDSISYHHGEGYTEVYQFQDSKDGPDSPFYLVKSLESHKPPRFIACGFSGQDAAKRVIQITGPAFESAQAQQIEHERAAPIYLFNPAGRALKLKPQDQIILGFQNTVWWSLHNSKDGENWKRTLLTSHSAEVSLYENKNTGQRVINTALVYGDEMREALQILYNKGGRNFVHLGTAGGLTDHLTIGDVMIPTQFLNKEGTIEKFANDARYLDLPSRLKGKTYANSTQSWIPTIIDETRTNMKKLKDHGVDAIDIEALYVYEFFKNHPDCKRSIVIVISDTPFGVHKYSDENITREIPIKKIEELVPILLHPLPRSNL
jgi:hypothetical protein